ncbi:MAG: hypothetical protein Q8R08_00670, partial [bacterium]|nr:hypothetical protein [bacterium]
SASGSSVPSQAFRYLGVQISANWNEAIFDSGSYGGPVIQEVAVYDASGTRYVPTLVSVTSSFLGTTAAGTDPSYDNNLATGQGVGNSSDGSGGTDFDDASTAFHILYDFGSPINISRITVVPNNVANPSMNSNILLTLDNTVDNTGSPNFYPRYPVGSPFVHWNNVSQNTQNYGWMVPIPSGQNLFSIANGLVPGMEAEFSFNITAPTIPGTYPFQWRMRNECVQVQGFDDTTPLQNITVNNVAPTVDLKANGGDALSPLNLNNALTLIWTTTNNPDSCTASGNWSGGKNPAGGSEDRTSDTATTGTKTYTLTCTKGSYSNSDTVNVPVVNVPVVCDPNVVGVNRMIGCVWRWPGAMPLANPPAINGWEMHSVAPAGPVQTSPASQNTTVLNNNWGGNGGPNGLVNGFYILWRGKFNFALDDYTFTADTNDGVAVYLDGGEIIEAWSHGSHLVSSAEYSLTGQHEIMMVYYENETAARAILSWSTTPPLPPDSLTYANPCGPNDIALTWQDESTNETGFHVWRNVGPSIDGPTITYNSVTYYKRANLGANVETWTDTSSPTGVSYSYIVTSYNGAGDSIYSGAQGNVSGSISQDPCVAELTVSSKCIDLVNGVPDSDGGACPWSGPTLRDGDIVTFRVIISNTGTSPAYSVYVLDTLTNTLAYQPGLARLNGSNLGGNETVNGQVIRWPAGSGNFGTLPNGTNWILTYQAKLSTASSQLIDFFDNTAVVNYQDPAGTGRTYTPSFPLTPFRTGLGRVPRIREIAP